MDIDSTFLKGLWEKQNGACPFTGWQMNLPVSHRVKASGWMQSRHQRNASLDRIDNSKGYVRGNVRFVALIANFARHVWTDDVVHEFAKAVVKNRSIKK